MTTVTAGDSLAILSEALGIGPVASVHYGPTRADLHTPVWWVRLEDGRLFVLGSDHMLRNTAALGRIVGHPGPIKRGRANRIHQALIFALEHTNQEVRHASPDR